MKTLNVDNTYKSNTNLTINELYQENKKIVSFIELVKVAHLF